MKSYGMSIQMKPLQQYFHMVPSEINAFYEEKIAKTKLLPKLNQAADYISRFITSKHIDFIRYGLLFSSCPLRYVFFKDSDPV
ncbi:unnamed protein product [Porites lobata]|uniref:Uncharacterized protein n=1 Tax=Porites lobata TaxID=104759 RepID=A0ABN8MWE9_9CNID|nr:unnamed protein product [Porites lobata]